MDRTSLRIYGGPASRMDARRSQLAGTPDRSQPSSETAIWEPAPLETDQPTTSDVLHRQPAQVLPAELEEMLVALLTQPIERTETHHHGNARRELAVREMFARLAPQAALELARRLDRMLPDDALAIAFLRITVDRRRRLRAFLESVKRAPRMTPAR